MIPTPDRPRPPPRPGVRVPHALLPRPPVSSSRLDALSDLDGDDDDVDVSWARPPPPALPESIKVNLTETKNRGDPTSVPQKPKLSKAERRAIQEAQRAAKAAAKETGVKSTAKASDVNTKMPKQPKAGKASLKKDVSQANALVASDKKTDEHPPDKDRKKDVPQPRMQFDDLHRVVKAKKRLDFNICPGDISGGNARCIAMLLAFREAINDYSTPAEKIPVEILLLKSSSYVSFLIECRPLSISMGNAIRFLKNRITKLALAMSESEAKASLQSDIDRFINEKIIVADKILVQTLRDKDYCAVLSNGTVYSRVGTASVAMVAHAFGVPVLICCEAYKFHERVQLDSICFNELDAVVHVSFLTLLIIKSNSCTCRYDITPSDYVSMLITDYGMSASPAQLVGCTDMEYLNHLAGINFNFLPARIAVLAVHRTGSHVH
ncbi:hypothetical protein HU200_010556 [Digitaria exilis]|uniref:Translation initiation factor eIF2B subunit delta n=1 Tax=Digitaria exilis TaxID=1010633 RepID=A0A835FHX4_9POAL|nr:hypothetical protein HU200_010556 [Digitaria exilis]